jgi:hypothetical protein
LAISTTTEKNNLATKYGQDAAYVALFTTAPSGGTAGTEVSGGTYARVAAGWSAPSSGVITGSVTINVPTGVTINGVGLYTAATGGTYVDGVTVTSQNFASAGTYTVALTYTQS